jgi:hypothetical protein
MITNLKPISDDQASSIVGGLSSVQSISGNLQQPLDLLAGSDALIVGNGTGPSGNSVGGLVSDTIGSGMSILGSALGGLAGIVGNAGQ